MPTRCASRFLGRFRHRDRNIIRPAARQDLANRHHGIWLPKQNVLRCLTALETVLARNGFSAPVRAAAQAAYAVYDETPA
ncbi:MAG: hypothetical protein Ct9H300mP16_15240 [Pseudomonadota bacterium]|nr:MAG: hypothetical protein Ct9H300mP16_15240 [Pseudomonadota bacterium]